MSNIPLSSIRMVGNIFYISGQIGQKNGLLVSENVLEQTIQAIENITTILKQNGLESSNVIDVTAFITEQSDYDAFNEAYGKSFMEPFPSRTTVIVKSLPLGARVELKAIASK